MSQPDYLEDPEIQKLLAKMDKAVSGWQSARMRGNYGHMCFALGQMHAITSAIYARNDRLASQAAIVELAALVTPSIPEELSAAFPDADASELACEGEHRPRIEDVLSSNQDQSTHPATVAKTTKVSPQAYYEAGRDCQDPS